MDILNANCVTAIPMEHTVTSVKWVEANVLARRTTEAKTVTDVKKDIMDFQTACVSI